MSFKNLSWSDLQSRYDYDQLKLVKDLMGFGLISSKPPMCYCKDYVECQLYKSDPWVWMCPNGCNSKTSIVTNGCFLQGVKKFYMVFREMYLWSQGCSPKFITRQLRCSKNTVTQLNVYWREVVTLYNDSLGIKEILCPP